MLPSSPVDVWLQLPTSTFPGNTSAHKGKAGNLPSPSSCPIPLARVATELLNLVLHSLGTYSWIRKGTQGSLEYLSHNDHAHWIVFCLLRPQESHWSKCPFCFRLPRGNIPLYRPHSAVQILLPVSIQAKREQHSCSECLEKFQQIQQSQKEVILDCWRLPSLSSPVHASFPWYWNC